MIEKYVYLIAVIFLVYFRVKWGSQRVLMLAVALSQIGGGNSVGFSFFARKIYSHLGFSKIEIQKKISQN